MIPKRIIQTWGGSLDFPLLAKAAAANVRLLNPQFDTFRPMIIVWMISLGTNFPSIEASSALLAFQSSETTFFATWRFIALAGSISTSMCSWPTVSRSLPVRLRVSV